MQKKVHFRWFIIAALSMACALSFFDRQVLSVLAPQITRDLHMDDVAYSWVVFAFILGYSVMFSVGGWLIDRIGTRYGMALSVGIWSLASLLHATAHNAVQLGAFRFSLGVGEGGCFPGAAKGVIEWTSQKERAVAMGIATSGGSALGAIVAPPLAVWTGVHAGWRAAFLVTGLAGIAWLLLWLVVCPTAQVPVVAVREALRDAAVRSRGSRSTHPWIALLKTTEVKGLVAARVLFDPVLYFYMFWVPQYLHQARGSSLQEIGRLTWIPFFVLGGASVLGGWISDRFVHRGDSAMRTRERLLVAAALVTPVTSLVGFAGNAEWAIALISFFMLAHGFWITNYMTLIGDIFPSQVVASVTGLTGTAGAIGGFVSSLVIGRVVESFSFTPVFVTAGLIYPISAAILLATIGASPRRTLDEADVAVPNPEELY